MIVPRFINAALRRALAGLLGLSLLLAEAGPARAGAGGASDLVRGLAALDEGDLIRFSPARAGQPVELELAARVQAPAEKVVALLADPAAYRRAVPAFVRAETLRREAGTGGAPPARLLAWELEIPLWNLEGQLWLRPRPDGATLQLVAGDLLPGRFSLTVVPEGANAILLLQGGANLKAASWITRRLAARHAYAEPAMAVAAFYVLLRALVLEAERPASGPARARWPRAPLRAPGAAALSGQPLGAVLAALAPLAPGAALAAVASRPDGRLLATQLGLVMSAPLERVQAGITQPGPWQALPGWQAIAVAPGDAPDAARWEVDARFPFVDFDARWAVTLRPRFRADARGGDWEGAAMGWDLLPAPGAAPGCLAVFTSNPRVDATGYLPRKLIEAEPLLEHGLALGLAYVNARSLLDALP